MRRRASTLRGQELRALVQDYAAHNTADAAAASDDDPMPWIDQLYVLKNRATSLGLQLEDLDNLAHVGVSGR